ncbi:quinate 5-dehydrogenase [Phosphitispora sp. TUW77]|uniref:quinate 5-dehydrogenase n=1 Tax=Phosphitispora sp. TUW77 TaxID=3152361 RepID=UPI003AB7FBC7
MKRVMSVSLGSSIRNHSVETEILGQRILIERIGTNGDIEKAIELIRKNDGQVNAFGLGGIDLYIYAGAKRYTFRDAKRIALAASKSPVVDGSGLKNTLERNVIAYLQNELGIVFANKKVLMVCAVDRFGMAESLSAAGAEMTFGDLIFALGLPVSISSINSLQRIARIIAPIIVKLPFKILYPTGGKQEQQTPKYGTYYERADIIAGDFHFIRRYMPEKLSGKCIITNTVTPTDIQLLKDRGIKQLITTTPEINGRSFGTNVMEAVLIALSGKKPDEMMPEDYSGLLKSVGFMPRVVNFAGEMTG